MNRRFFLGLGALYFLFNVSPAFAVTTTGDSAPTALVETLHKALLSAMKSAATTSVRQRFNTLAPVVSESFHAGLMVQVASGSYWRKASPAQRTSLTNAFASLSTATYAAQFDGYSGQSFKTLAQKPGPQNTILVETEIVDPGGRNVTLTYVTRKIKQRWQIVDVLLDTGISELARKRSEYRQVLKSDGVEGLVAMLKHKTGALLAN